MARFTLPKTLAKLTGGSTEVEADGDTLLECLTNLTGTYQLDDALLDTDGNMQPYIRVVMDDALVRDTSNAGLAAQAVSGGTVQIKTAFAGG